MEDHFDYTYLSEMAIESKKDDPRYDLLIKNLAEVIDPEGHIRAQMGKNNPDDPLKIYWGTATTGKPHLGYLVPMLKIKDYLLAGAHVTILFADIHAMLDNLKSTEKLILARTQYYQFLIMALLECLVGKDNLNKWTQKTDKSEPLLRFVVGSSFQKSSEYTMDLYKLLSLNTVKSAQHAGAEVVKQSKDPLLSALVYPLMQALDEEYLNVHVQFGGVDQRKIFMCARDNLPKIGYKKRAYLMNPLIPGLTKTGKMSSSEPLSKIDFDDDDEVIRSKIEKAFSIDGQVEKNGLVAIIKYILFELYPEGFLVKRDEKYGGDVYFANYAEFETAFSTKKIGSVDLKPTIAELLIEWIRPLREMIRERKDLVNAAYPEVVPIHSSV